MTRVTLAIHPFSLLRFSIDTTTTMAETQIEVPPLLPAPSAALLAEIEGGAAAGCVLRKLPGFGTKGQKGPRVQVAPVGAGYRRLQSHAAFGAPKSGAAAKAGGGADKAAKSKKDKKQKKKKKSGSQLRVCVLGGW